MSNRSAMQETQDLEFLRPIVSENDELLASYVSTEIVRCGYNFTD